MSTSTEVRTRNGPVAAEALQVPVSSYSTFNLHTHAVKLANLHRSRSTTQTLVAIINNYIIIFTSIIATEIFTRSLHRPGCANIHKPDVTTSYIATALGALALICAILIISSRLRAFEVLVHEASHHNLFPSVKRHYTTQFLYSYPVFRDVVDYRRDHLVHHKHLGDPAHDPDVQRLIELGLDALPSSPGYFLFGLPATGYLTYEWLTNSFLDFWTSVNARPAKALYWTLVVSGVWYFGLTRLWATYYLCPLLTVLPVTRYWAELAEHAGLDMTGPFGNSRNNLGFWHRWYLYPHNDGYHAVHHLHAQVPFSNLPRAHAVLMQESEAFREKTVCSTGVMDMMRQVASSATQFKNKAANQ